MSTEHLTTYYCEYSILPDQSTRDACMTYFGGMTHDDDLKDLGEVILLGRWACVGEAKGFCVVKAKCNVCVQKWLNNWVSMADIKVVPCLDDNEHRKLILGNDPSYLVPYGDVDKPALDGQDLFFIKYKFREGHRDQGFQAFANMTEDQDKNDSGLCTSYGRWHVPSQGCGFAIASTPSAFDIYKWAYNWNALCDVDIIPVTRDEQTREVIKGGMGFQFKHNMLMEEMSEMM